MGIVISTTNYAPLALVSAVIGFVSFAFTVATFLRIVWVNLETMSEVPHEVHGYLTTLRTELLEERASIRVLRRISRRYHRQHRRDGGETFVGIELDDVTLKTMADTVKRLIRRFKAVEKPFLAPSSDGIDDWKKHRSRRRNSSVSPYYEHSAYASPPEKGDGGGGGGSGGARSRVVADRGRRGRGRSGPDDEDYEDNKDDDHDDDDERFWAQRTKYRDFTLRQRFRWLYQKPRAQALVTDLSRVQIRRVARQVAGVASATHEYGRTVCANGDVLRRIEDRMNTIVGVRRING